MNLLPPRIKGPVSECSSHVWVQGQIPGAAVEIVDLSTGSVLASEVASSADAVLTLSSSLQAGNFIAASQKLGSDDSGVSADRLEVQSKPPSVGSGVFPQPIFECARCVYVDGLVPGAEVKLETGSGTIGTAHSHIGYARIGLTSPISGALVLHQNACGEDGEPRTVNPLDAVGDEKQGKILPAPNVEDPLQACRTRLDVSKIYPGATVELERSMGPNGQSCFDLPTLWWGMNPPLQEGETVRARQGFPDCDTSSEWSMPPVVVGPAEPVAVPYIVGPLCAKGTSIRVCGLLASATVEITIVRGGHHGVIGGDVFVATAPEDGCFDFPLPEPGLPAEAIVCVSQTLCGKTSDISAEVKVDDQPGGLPEPRVFDPLFDCSITVHVGDLMPGTRVYVYADGIGVIGERHVDEEEVDVTVRPALQKGWKVYAVARGCGHESDKSNVAEVKEAPEQLDPPLIEEPVYNCDREVTVTKLVPGASVDIFVDGNWVGRGQAGTDTADITVSIGPLKLGDQISAQQQICDAKSRIGPEVTVSRFDGEWELLSNSNGDPIEDKSGVLAVHASLLPSGQILIFAGDQYTNDSEPIDNTRLMKAGAPWTVKSISGIPDGYNLFCCGHSMLADGTLLTGGGTHSRPPQGAAQRHRDHWLGLRGSLRFRPEADGPWDWEKQGDMVTARPSDVRSGFDASNSGGRWYPTLVTLGDGRVLAIGGHPLDGDLRHTNTSMELYDPATKNWSIVGTTDYVNIPGRNEAISRSIHSEYPSLHVLPDGTVFAASAMADGDMWKWNVGSNSQSWDRVATTPPGYGGNPQPYTSVILPLREDSEFRSTVLLYGKNTAYTINPQSAPTNWSATTGRTLSDSPPRIYPLATLLPTGEVFISGGTRDGKDATAIFEPEIYDPSDGSWRTVEEEASQARNYHSTALLLPDGSVWHSGSNIDCKPGYDTQNLTVEIYRPWYFCWPRPRLDRVTSRVCHGQTLSMRTPDANRIKEAVLVRLGSFTHAFNPDQRHIALEIEQDKEDAHHITAKLPSNPNVAIVGHYMCFVLDQDGVPSKGVFMQVCPDENSQPDDNSDKNSPAVDWREMFDAFVGRGNKFELPDDAKDRFEQKQAFELIEQLTKMLKEK